MGFRSLRVVNCMLCVVRLFDSCCLCGLMFVVYCVLFCARCVLRVVGCWSCVV